jgi:hypothetical protein
MTNTIDKLLGAVPPAAHPQFLRRYISATWEAHHGLMGDLKDRNHPFFRESLHELLTIKVTCQDLITDGLITMTNDPITISKAKHLANLDIERLTTLAKWQAKSQKLQ